MRVISLGSSSSGNAFLIEAGPQGRTKILVDAGFPTNILSQRLRMTGVFPAQLQGVLITHEHSDHILGLPTLMKRYAIPVIGDPRTLSAIERIIAEGILRTESGTLVSLEREPEVEPREGPGRTEWPGRTKGPGRPLRSPLQYTRGPFRPPDSPGFSDLAVGSRRVIGDIEVASFPVSHDAVAPCGYLVSAGGCRVCVAIDTGEVTSTMLEVMNQADLLILESNHDRERLLRGPYPNSLKQRILSSTGHLSNDQAADAVLRTWRGDAVRWLWLSHLSRTNNTPKLALSSMRNRLQQAKANLAQVHISILSPGMGGVWDSTQLWHALSLWEMQV